MVVLRLILACSLILLTPTVLAAQTVMQALQVQPTLNEARITFMLTEKVKGKVTYLPMQKILVVEFPLLKKAFDKSNTRFDHMLVESVTTKTYQKKLQFYFGLRDQVRWKIDYLSSINSHENRLLLSMQALHPITTSKISKNDIDKALADLVAKKKSTDAMPTQTTVTTKQKVASLFTVVIDAGHGGHDSGAVSQDGLQEKKVVLAIAQKLAREINSMPTMRAVLTRKGDYFVPLRQRLKLARKGDADLFVAVHADAHYDKNAQGASVYALSAHGATTEAARWLAQKENYSELGDVELNTLQDRSPLLRSVLIDLAQTATIEDSLKLGNQILNKLDDIAKLHYKRVEQAPFVVLKSPDIPSVLVETGFISHPVESKKLASPIYQSELAHALFLGIKKYAEK